MELKIESLAGLIDESERRKEKAIEQTIGRVQLAPALERKPFTTKHDVKNRERALRTKRDESVKTIANSPQWPGLVHT